MVSIDSLVRVAAPSATAPLGSSSAVSGAAAQPAQSSGGSSLKDRFVHQAPLEASFPKSSSWQQGAAEVGTGEREGGGEEAPLDVADLVMGINEVHQMGYTGRGQTIAVIDSGIAPHPDLADKITGWVDLVDGSLKPTDTDGHGTHVAGIAAGTGKASQGVFKGIAPEANLVGVRVGGTSDAIKGLQWVVENKDRLGIGVVNLSLGIVTAAVSYQDDPLCQAVEKAIQAGLIVCAAAGNFGELGSYVTSPGNHPDVITVGALDDRGTVDRSDDRVAPFSSRGNSYMPGETKPDLLAPGVKVIAPRAEGAKRAVGLAHKLYFDGQYVSMNGTSMATPMVSGLAACLKQANPTLDHYAMREILMRSCDRYLDDPANAQGKGLVNAPKALELALSKDIAESVRELQGQSAPVKEFDFGYERLQNVSDQGFKLA